MKKVLIIGLLAAMLTGCAAQETMETVGDAYMQPVSGQTAQQVLLDLPQDAHQYAMQSQEGEDIYLCDDYTVTVQILPAGDLNRTVQDITGYPKDALTLMQTRKDGIKRYMCVWSCAGEGEDQVGKACVLDDGSYHYAVSVMAGQSKAGDLQKTWQSLFDSVRLVDGNIDLNTGS